MLKLILEQKMGWHHLDSAGSRHLLEAGNCEYSNEPLSYTQCGEFHD